MHRLRTFRKAKEEDESVPPVPTPPSNHKGFKWGKSSSPPPKQQPEVDLQHVLPPTDDFRISLLMPNLAQRFSILQMEQAAAAAAAAAGRKVNGEDFAATGAVEGGDGPAHTPPAFAPLGDIAETSSIAGSTIGAATQQNRLTTKSEESSNLEQDGSIMNRSRGGEGNVLFGGRQKVYRVPTGASRVDSSEDLPGRSASPMSGRVVYDHDVTDSAFAKPRKGSLDRGASMEGSGDYDKNRFTSSSTNSTPTTTTRFSTAATSVASNTNSVSLPTAASVSPLPTVGSGSMASSKPRRPLYEQALDQQLQDHQNSAAGRLERLASIRKLGTTSPPMANYANGHNFQPAQQYTSPTSPTSIHNGNQWPRKRPDSPLSPPEEVAHEEEEEKTAELDPSKQGPDLSTPNIGTFNFGLEPVSQTPLSPPVSANAVEFPARGPFRPGNLAGEQTERGVPDRVVSPPPEEERIPLGGLGGRRLSRDEDRAKAQTFLSLRSNSSESSYGDESDDDSKGRGRNVAPLQLTKQPTVSMGQSPESVSPVSPISPASNSERASDKSVSPNLLPLRNPAISPTSPRFSDINFTADDDSPTLPPAQGLGVLVRQHLRSDSGHSSMYAGSTYNRMSRNSRYGASNGKQASVYGASKGSSGSGTARPSGASGSSGGNLWEFDDWDGVDYADDENGPPSPSTISDSQGITAPSIPQKAPGRTPDLKSSGDKREEGDWNKERELAMSRAGERERNRSEEEDEQDKDWEQQLAFRRQIIQQNLRNQEKVNSQHDMPFPPPDLREGPPRSNGPGFNILKSKSSNGFLAKGDAARGPRAPGMEPPINGLPMRPGGRGGMMYDEERMLRDTVRGPHNMPPPPHHHHHPHHPMMHQPPHHLPPHPRQFQGQQTLATGQPYNRYPPGERSPIGLPHPLHSPMHAPRMRPRPSQEQMNSAQSTPRGVPMGWRDENWGLPRSAPGTQPATPTTPRDVRMPRKQPSMPGMNGRRDDMRQPPNQGQQFRGREDMRGYDREPRRPPGGPPPHHPPQPRPQYDAPSRPGHESVETSPPPPSHDFRRPRNGSNASPAPTMRQRRGTLDSTPLPPLNTSMATAAALVPPKQSQPSSAATPYSAVSSDRSPAIIQRTPTTAGSGGPPPPPAVVSSAMTSIQNSNAGFAPAKKRAVDKSQIGEPKLLSATSNIPTRALPPQDPTPPLSDPSRSAKPRSRRMTTTQNIFGGFGKNKSSEEVPSIPSSNHKSDDEIERSSFTDDPPPKKSKGGKLRKSTSDGGALASRSRQQAMARGPSVPKIQKVMVGMPAQNMDTPGGMI